jgi:hypothetical protein
MRCGTTWAMVDASSGMVALDDQQDLVSIATRGALWREQTSVGGLMRRHVEIVAQKERCLDLS